MNPDLKVYDTRIELDGSGEGLRTGMSCEAQIVVAHYDDAIYVPIEAVLRIGGKSTVFVQRGDQAEPRTVELGLDSDRKVRIIKGLEAGETVLVEPPLASAMMVGLLEVTATEIERLRAARDERETREPEGQTP